MSKPFVVTSKKQIECIEEITEKGLRPFPQTQHIIDVCVPVGDMGQEGLIGRNESSLKHTHEVLSYERPEGNRRECRLLQKIHKTYDYSAENWGPTNTEKIKKLNDDFMVTAGGDWIGGFRDVRAEVDYIKR